MARIPIDYEGVSVSIEMPKTWAESEFGYKSVPPDVRSRMQRTGGYTICMKTIDWSRGLFRGLLGTLYADICLFDPTLAKVLRREENERTREMDLFLEKADFTRPADLGTYLAMTFMRHKGQEGSRISYVERRGVVWVRVSSDGRTWNGVPEDQFWFVGVGPECFARFDLLTSREYAGRAGDNWHKSVLFWTNKMIESLTVTGLNQDIAGIEDIERWTFPEVLEYPKESAK